MALRETYESLVVDELLGFVRSAKEEGARFVQMCATADEEGMDLLYTFRRGEVLDNRMVNVSAPGTVVPSITDYYLEAFVFENEAHDLFGVHIEGIAIDFSGKFYNVSVATPMAVKKEGGNE